MLRTLALLALGALAGCTSSNSAGDAGTGGGCRCTNAVPGGTLDLPCGASGCLQGMGYRCLDTNRYENNPLICGLDMSMAPPPPDFSGIDLAGRDFSVPIDLYGFDLAGQLGCNGVENCARACTNTTCINNCYNRLSPEGMTLDNDFFSCQVNFCSSYPAPDGGFACVQADLDILNGITMTGTVSAPCQMCLGNYGFVGVWSTACASQIAACRANTP
jgi:hypothetical protein